MPVRITGTMSLRVPTTPRDDVAAIQFRPGVAKPVSRLARSSSGTQAAASVCGRGLPQLPLAPSILGGGTSRLSPPGSGGLGGFAAPPGPSRCSVRDEMIMLAVAEGT
jgi:hypothetical protein